MHISTKICVSVLLLASEFLCLHVHFIINIRILVIKLQLSSYKFLRTFYGTKLKNTLIDGMLLISCKNCFFWKMHHGLITIYNFLIWQEYYFNQFTNLTSLYINLLKFVTIIFPQCRLSVLAHSYVWIWTGECPLICKYNVFRSVK